MLTTAEKAKCLQAGIFAGLAGDVLLAVAERVGERELEDSETLFLEGEPGDEIYIIVAGEVVIHLGEHVIARLGSGEVFGEMAVFGNGRRTASARSRGKTRLLFIKDKAIKILVQQSPEIAFAFFRILLERLEESNRVVQFFAGERRCRGVVEIVAPPAAVGRREIWHEESFLGRARGVAADVLRIAIPFAGGELRERHARVMARHGAIYLAPYEGEVRVNGEEIADWFEVMPQDEIEMGGLRMRICAGAAGERGS